MQLTLKQGETVPPGWEDPHAVVAYQGKWWRFRSLWTDNNSLRRNWDLEESPKAPTVIETFDIADDPEWAEGDEVDDPNGVRKKVVHSNRTTMRVTYYGTPVPPPDPPALTNAFE